MINEGGFLESLAMRSSGAATGTRTTMPARSISTTTGPTTTTTTSASADPKIKCLDIEHAHGKSILGRESPGEITPKARRQATPKTAAGLTSAAAERGNDKLPSDFKQLTGLSNLYYCWLNAKRNKSKRLRVQQFGEDPLRYLTIIQERLQSRSYSFGPYKSFTVREKKFRHVVDAPMKDRVVHWMLYDYMLPIWQPRFIHDTYGNLPGRGTHAAVRRLAEFCRAPASKWVLQLDISKYFYSVNHDILKARVLRYIGDNDLRQLLIALVDSFRTDGQYDDLFPTDSMYRQTATKGMPIGNLSSQLFANIFLNDFDHWIKQTLRIKKYIRYVDDMVILSETPDELHDICSQIVQKLAVDGLTIHPKKIRLAPTSAGVPFLGYVVWPAHISAGKYVRGRYLHRLRQHECGGFDRTETLESYRAIFSHTGSTLQRKAA
ncbi:reverse transcriptase domain-containing protein [Undibacterium arcticum]|uniref:Reverse transcriptase domain-containing protein n=1 Tax=Undibacterium arcticum TaxID=1762892 RepID=A0ABV7EXE7_9BURK